MKRTALLLIILSLATAVRAQWTLDSCISYALAHNIDLQKRSVDLLTAEYSVTEAKDRFLPQVNAFANEGLNFGRGLTSQNTYANRNTQNFSWGADLSLPLFQGLSAIRQLDYAKVNLQAIAEQCEAARDDVTLNVITAYLQVLYTRELLEVAHEQTILSEAELQRRETMLQAGKVAELDVLESRSQLAQSQLTETNSDNDHRLSLVALAQLLQLTDLDGFEVAPLSDTDSPLLSADDVYRNALAHNHALQAGRLRVDAAGRSVSAARSGYLPTLSFGAGLGSSYYKVSGLENPSFGSQMRDNFNKSLNFSLRIPLFDGLTTRNNVRRAEASLLTARLDLADAETRLFQTIQQAYYQAINAEKKHQSASVALTSTRAAFEAMQTKYDYGRANATEYEQARAAYIKARAETVQAHYEALLRYRILEFYNRN